MTYPVRGLHYGPALAITLTGRLWTQAGSIPASGNQARAGIVTLRGGLPRAPQHPSHRDDGSLALAGFTLPVLDSDAASSLGYGDRDVSSTVAVTRT